MFLPFIPWANLCRIWNRRRPRVSFRSPPMQIQCIEPRLVIHFLWFNWFNVSSIECGNLELTTHSHNRSPVVSDRLDNKYERYSTSQLLIYGALLFFSIVIIYGVLIADIMGLFFTFCLWQMDCGRLNELLGFSDFIIMRAAHCRFRVKCQFYEFQIVWTRARRHIKFTCIRCATQNDTICICIDADCSRCVKNVHE